MIAALLARSREGTELGLSAYLGTALFPKQNASLRLVTRAGVYHGWTKVS